MVTFLAGAEDRRLPFGRAPSSAVKEGKKQGRGKERKKGTGPTDEWDPGHSEGEAACGQRRHAGQAERAALVGWRAERVSELG